MAMQDPLAKADWGLIPLRYQKALKGYFQHGRRPDVFLRSCLAFDLRGVLRYRLPPTDLEALDGILLFLKEYAPPESYGTRIRVARWISDGGLDGQAPQIIILHGVPKSLPAWLVPFLPMVFAVGCSCCLLSWEEGPHGVTAGEQEHHAREGI